MATPAKSKPAPLSEFAPLADELGSLEKEMAPHAQKLSRIEALKKALRTACTAKPGDQWTVDGARFIAVLGPCANKRIIDFPRLVKAIGAGVFAKFATCTLTDIEEHVPPTVAAAVVSQEAAGSRSLKTFEKGT
jgi:hypothetical protein